MIEAYQGIHVLIYDGINVVLNIQDGRFFAVDEDGDMVFSETLSGLKKTIDNLKVQKKNRQRKNLQPVPIVIIDYGSRSGTYTLWRGEVVGIVTGKSYTRRLRVRESGQTKVTQLKMGIGSKIVCFHPDDPRVGQLEHLIDCYTTLSIRLKDQERSIQSIIDTLIPVTIPPCDFKEHALEAEVALLTELATLTPLG